VLIFLMFLVPLVTAVLLQPERFGSDPVNTVNRGDLVDPPVPLDLNRVMTTGGTPAVDIAAGRWLVLHLLSNPCDERCQSVMTDLRQIHIGTGRHRDEVALLLIGSTDYAKTAASIYDGFHFAETGELGFAASLTAAYGASGGRPLDSGDGVIGSTFIVDPEGNLMLRYAPGYDRADLNKDLKKLLKWSGR
jgi:hypothetical protein